MGNADSKKKTDGDKRLSKGAPSTSTFSGTQAKREQICGEILSTEETYIRGLTTLDRYYRTGLVTCGVKEKELGQIFSTVPHILALHNDKVLPQLQLRCTPTAPAKSRWCVAQVFLDFLDQYPLYSNFINNYETALDRVAKLRKKKKQVDEVFDNAKGLKETNGLDFFSLFITIVQRLPRYVLLLQDLLKHTSAEDKEHRLLSKALTTLSACAAEINERKAAYESMNELVRLAASIGAVPIKLDTPGRRIMEAAEVHASHHQKTSASKDAKYWLFNDCIIFARRQPAVLEALGKPWKVIHFSFLFQTEFIDDNAAQNIVRIESSTVKKPLFVQAPPPSADFISKMYVARSRAPKSLAESSSSSSISRSASSSSSSAAASSSSSGKKSTKKGQIAIDPQPKVPEPGCNACQIQ